jgi:hypothetical protein
LKKLINSVLIALLWVLLGYVVWGLDTRHRYLDAFQATTEGEPLAEVLKRFGPPSHIEPRSNAPGYDFGSRSACGESCWLRIWYELPFSLGVSPVSVDFDSRQLVIHKYQWNSP